MKDNTNKILFFCLEPVLSIFSLRSNILNSQFIREYFFFTCYCNMITIVPMNNSGLLNVNI